MYVLVWYKATSHLNALAAKDKKTLGVDPTFMYHGLVIPDEIPPPDVENTQNRSTRLPTIRSSLAPEEE